MKIINTQQPADGVIVRQIKNLAELIRQDRQAEAVADLESQFARQRGVGLFIDTPPRVATAQAWAELMDTRYHTRQYSQWLKAGYLTGRWFGYFIILFPIPGIDGGLPAGFFCYRLTGDRFGSSARWFEAPLWVELNQKGKLVPDASPLPLDGCYFPTPGAVQQYRRDWRKLRRFKQSHNGRSPEEEKAYQERRRRWRDNNQQKD